MPSALCYKYQTDVRIEYYRHDGQEIAQPFLKEKRETERTHLKIREYVDCSKSIISLYI